MSTSQEELSNPTPPSAPLIKRRPNYLLATVIALIGVATFAFFWPLGGGLILGAAVLDRAVWLCGACGSRAEKTSRLCPVCGVPLK